MENELGSGKDRVNDPPSHPAPLPMNDPEVYEAPRVRLAQVFSRHRLEVSVGDAVKIEDIPDLERHRGVEGIRGRVIAIGLLVRRRSAGVVDVVEERLP